MTELGETPETRLEILQKIEANLNIMEACIQAMKKLIKYELYISETAPKEIYL
jgi:hypothetical protein